MLSCYGISHNTSNRRFYPLSAWQLEAEAEMGVTWRSPSNAVTTEVVTTNGSISPIPPIPPILQ
ncbi:hypothetical protein [Laspinema palackyanum]|uniref:hypothetical protein n=1 Tax=Laspinema palackyanum TaxID=3231601 RepID=UPI00349F8E0F